MPMKSKSSAYYQRLYRQRLRDQGLVKKEIWILPEHAKALAHIERQLRTPQSGAIFTDKENGMNTMPQVWTANSLYAALSTAPLFAEGRAAIELLQGADSSLHVQMHEYGELPLFIAVSGEQIVIEGTLWSCKEVKDMDKFNDAVLRTHKLFPLSSIALETPPDAEDYYTMFGALSATSSLENIVLEIEVLADNIIKATEAYADHLKESA